jgi:hypothetical protein
MKVQHFSPWILLVETPDLLSKRFAFLPRTFNLLINKYHFSNKSMRLCLLLAKLSMNFVLISTAEYEAMPLISTAEYEAMPLISTAEYEPRYYWRS